MKKEPLSKKIQAVLDVYAKTLTITHDTCKSCKIHESYLRELPEEEIQELINASYKQLDVMIENNISYELDMAIDLVAIDYDTTRDYLMSLITGDIELDSIKTLKNLIKDYTLGINKYLEIALLKVLSADEDQDFLLYRLKEIRNSFFIASEYYN